MYSEFDNAWARGKLSLRFNGGVTSAPDQRQNKCTVEYAELIQSVFNKSFELAHCQLGKAASRQKKGYDKNLRPRSFEVGNWV